MNKALSGLLLSFLLGLGTACSLAGPAATPTPPGQVATPSQTAEIPKPDAGTPLLPVLPGEPTPSASPEGALSPIALPDSLKVVYLKDGELWLCTRVGSRQLTTAGGAYALRLSDDGQLAAFSRQVGDFQAELWVVDLAGGGERRLVGVDAFNAIAEGVRDPNAMAVIPHQFEWVPGEHLLAFGATQVYAGPSDVLLHDLQIVNADNGERWTLLQPGEGGQFTYSPDGKQVAIVTPTDISLMNANAGNWRLALNYPQVTTYSVYRYYAQPVWAPDSSHLRVAIPPADPLAGPLDPTNLWYIPTDGGAAYQVGSVVAVPVFDTPVSFSPDLSKLIYLQEIGMPSENRRELRIASADGSGEWVYAEGVMLGFQGWGDDSLHFSFVTGEEQAMYLGRLDAPAKPLSADPYGVYELSWVDGAFYVYTKQVDEGFELHLGSPGGGDVLIDVVTGAPPAFEVVD
jgi:dipeptidyl aminopeptidase/acylaminoacyl peptidase